MPNLSATYGRPWQCGSMLGEHDEAGVIIETIDHIRVLLTPDVDAVARTIGLARHSHEAWQAYVDLADLIVQDHNDALEREEHEGVREVHLK